VPDRASTDDPATPYRPASPRPVDSGGWGPETRVTAGRPVQPPPANPARPEQPPARPARLDQPPPSVRQPRLDQPPPSVRAPRPGSPAAPPLTAAPPAGPPAGEPVPPPGVQAVLRQAARAQRGRTPADERGSATPGRPPRAQRPPAEPKGPGLPGWAAVLLLGVVAGLGGLIDGVGGSSLKGIFAIGLIVGSLAAIIAVRRREMFPVIVAPPLIYFGASAVLL